MAAALTWAWVALAAVVGPARAEHPRPSPGWRISLVAEAPVVRHPSVVACAPDGRVFVAEDPMDISRPAHAAEGRVLCLHPDGRWTVFAEGLHAVFGMQYLEGRLYVLHNPRFSAFRDDHGVGRDREELVDQTNPNPWALDWNDHVPANFRLGLDGFFHVAVGDKGMFKARGRDGRVVSLRGGGMVRIRPDGTGLAVHSTGVRNILDVAGTAEDDWFTYDNTDEHQWMGRLTHMIDGGFYGYPFDFIPRRPYTLWMLADYGAGAATGMACALGDALPGDHHGNLFLADFGQRNIRRVVLARDGATFKAIHDENLLAGSPADFRPVGIAFNDDNSILYVCDWQHRDTKEQAVTGRLWKLERESPRPGRPLPAWHVAHGLGRAVAATDEELIAGLAHPVHAVRVSAQRILGGRGHAALPALKAALADRSHGTQARIHALWAMDAIEAGRPALNEVLDAARSTNAPLARQVLRQLGQRMHPEARPVAEATVDQAADPSVRLHAALALARVGDARSVPPLVSALDSPELFLRHAAFNALREVGLRHPEAWGAMVPALGHSSAVVRENVAHAFRDAFSPQLVRALAAVASDASQGMALRAAALRALAPLHHREPEWTGDWWAYHPFRLQPPARTVPWTGTPDVIRALAAAAEDASPALRAIAADALGGLPASDGAELLLARMSKETDPAARTNLLQSVARMRPAAAAATAVRMLRESSPGLPLPAEAVALARALGGDAVHDALLSMLPGEAGDPRIPAVIALLSEARVAKATPALVAALESRDPAARDAALRGAREGRWKDAVPTLLRMAGREETRELARAALLATPDARAVGLYVELLGTKDARARAMARQALASVRDEAWTGIAPGLAGMRPEVAGELQRIYRGHAAAMASGLMQLPAPGHDAAALMAAALQHSGNVERGRALFGDASGLACGQCHRVQGHGGAIGPDLSGIGAQLDARAMAEAVLWPSKSVREGYDVVVLGLDDDEAMSGMVRSETTTEIVLQPAGGEPVRVPKARVRRRESTGRSLMPEGLGDGLTPEAFADLLAYLASLRSGS